MCLSPPAFDVVSLASVRVIEEGDIGFHRFTMCYNDFRIGELVDNGWVLDLALRPSACARLIAGAETGVSGRGPRRYADAGHDHREEVGAAI